MSGLDLARLARVRVFPHPILQRVVAYAFLWPNFRFLPGVRIDWEGLPDLPKTPVLLAINHTDRYNYFPVLWRWWWDLGRYTVVWAKGNRGGRRDPHDARLHWQGGLHGHEPERRARLR